MTTHSFDDAGNPRCVGLQKGVSLAWVWSQYQGVLPADEGRRSPAAEAGGATLGLNGRTKRGLILGGAVLIGLISFWLSALLLGVAASLIAWGQAPKRTEEFARGLPLGDYLLKTLGRLDAMLSSRPAE